MQADTWTEVSWFYNLFHAIFYSYGTDNNYSNLLTYANQHKIEVVLFL